MGSQSVDIGKISYYLPSTCVTNSDLAEMFPNSDISALINKVGIKKRYRVGVDETATDMAVRACQELFSSYQIIISHLEALLFVTQSPDYALPTSACVIQHKLNLNKDILALDINLGCSGFVNGLSIAKGLILSGTVRNCLLVCAETYSKYIGDGDYKNSMLFSDAGVACLVESNERSGAICGDFVFGSDGSGASDLIVPGSGARQLAPSDESYLHMNGSGVFMFTMREIPKLVEACLKKNNLDKKDIDLFVFHQASGLVLDMLTNKLAVEPHKVFRNLENVGNTVSCTIPIAIKDAVTSGRIKAGSNVLLAGFGVGLSWGATIITWGKR